VSRCFFFFSVHFLRTRFSGEVDPPGCPCLFPEEEDDFSSTFSRSRSLTLPSPPSFISGSSYSFIREGEQLWCQPSPSLFESSGPPSSTLIYFLGFFFVFNADNRHFLAAWRSPAVFSPFPFAHQIVWSAGASAFTISFLPSSSYEGFKSSFDFFLPVATKTPPSFQTVFFYLNLFCSVRP